MGDQLRDPREVMREEMLMRGRVLAALREGPKTVPEIAEIVGSPVHEVMYWVMAARRYGYVEESKEPTEENYYQYMLVEEK
jgi:predicted Rossmann fold nucleotide-binding protein DprA/Smf involved in DNA uptake